MTTHNQKGSGIVAVLIVIVVIAVIVGAGYVIYHSHHKTKQSVVTPTQSVAASTTKNAAILAPQTAGPVNGVSECSETVSYAQDGNIGNADCANGAINVLAWKAFAASNPLVMKLGRNTTQTQLLTAMCDDLGPTSDTTGPLTINAAQTVGQYNGWNFVNSTAITGWTPGICPD